MPTLSSSIPLPPRTASEPSDELIEKVVRRLQTSGELMRLAAFIPGRLSELGWCERVLDLCREYLRKHSASGPGIATGAPPGSTNLPEPSEIRIEDMVKELTPQAQLWLPAELHAELKNRIMEFIGEQQLD